MNTVYSYNGKRQSLQQAVWESWTATTHPLIIYKITHDTVKPLEENIGETFSDINRSYVFLGQSPKAAEIKTKTKKRDLIKLKNFYTARKP